MSSQTAATRNARRRESKQWMDGPLLMSATAPFWCGADGPTATDEDTPPDTIVM